MAAELKLSHTAAMILHAIHAGDGYGFSVMEITGLPSGTVYPAMRRLERDGLIRSQWERQSIADALWLRRNHPPEPGFLLRLNSPVHCVSLLVVLAAVSTLLAFRLPGPRDAILRSPYRDAERLVTIRPVSRSASRLPEVPIETWR